MPVVFTSMIGVVSDNAKWSSGVLDPSKEVRGVGQTSQVWLDCVAAERDADRAWALAHMKRVLKARVGVA